MSENASLEDKKLAGKKYPQCSYIRPSGVRCTHRTSHPSQVCYSHRKSPRVFDDPVGLTITEIMENPQYLYSHDRAAQELVRNGTKILAIGSTAWPDLLFEMDGRVFAAEVKGKDDRVRPYQRSVIQGSRRLENVYVLRASGTKHDADELTAVEIIEDIRLRKPRMGNEAAQFSL